jgi:hypothetical protein
MQQRLRRQNRLLHITMSICLAGSGPFPLIHVPFFHDGASTLCVRQDGNSYSFLPKENFCARLILSCDIHSPGYSDDLLGVTVHTIVEKSLIRYLINVFAKYSSRRRVIFRHRETSYSAAQYFWQRESTLLELYNSLFTSRTAHSHNNCKSLNPSAFLDGLIRVIHSIISCHHIASTSPGDSSPKRNCVFLEPQGTDCP